MTFSDLSQWSGQHLILRKVPIASLPGPYTDRAAGITAGEEYCRAQGWNDTAIRSSSNDNEAAIESDAAD